jgi:hypothetical protein
MQMERLTAATIRTEQRMADGSDAGQEAGKVASSEHT